MEYLVALVCFVVVMVALRVWHARRDRKRRLSRPPRHLGEPRSQRGRVYKNPPSTNHNADPYSGWP
ncbi:hypothetical protein [Paenarthrobacter sp. C1]|uniref:hypothetical protein n=1 Tax=Paenarthrobacter sp. C1 TaxID=3400220 RepID=UPI003BF472CC